MTRVASLAAAAGCCLLLAACATQTHRSGLVVADVTVISPERATPLQHAYVRMVDGRIAEVSQRRLHGETEIAGAGRYLIPGLIDSHVHLAIPPGFPAPMTSEQAAAHPHVVAEALEQDPKSFLFFGFTTVFDLIGTAERTARWNARELRPDAYFCSALVFIGGQMRLAFFPRFSYNAPVLERVSPVPGPGEGTPEAVVARIATGGASCIKTIHEQPIAPTAEQLRLLVEAAHARNLPVFIHANREKSQAVAVAAGVDVIAHGMWRDTNEPAALDEEAREILSRVIRDHLGYQPTTQVIVGLVDAMRTDYLARPGLADAYPASLIDLYSSEGVAGTPRWLKGSGDNARDRLRETVGRANEVTRILAQGNAHLLFGSDTPSDLIYTNPPGLNGRLEMDNWIAAGVPLEKLFHALTIDNARILRLQDQLGTVETGKTANLLLLRADPLQSVKAYDTIETVFLHGRPIARAALSARNASSRER